MTSRTEAIATLTAAVLGIAVLQQAARTSGTALKLDPLAVTVVLVGGAWMVQRYALPR